MEENALDGNNASVEMVICITRKETGKSEEYKFVGVADMADVIESGIPEATEVKEQ